MIFHENRLLADDSHEISYLFFPKIKKDVAAVLIGVLRVKINSLHAFLSSDFFQNQLFQKRSFMNTIRVSNSLDPDQAQHFVGPDLGPNCLQRLPADDKSHQ